MRVRHAGWYAVLAGLALTGCDAAPHGTRASCPQATTPASSRAPGPGLLAMGVPKGRVGAYTKAGYVVVANSTGDRRQLSQASPGVPGDPVARGGFGAAVTAGDFDHDGRLDLAVASSGGDDTFHSGSVTILPAAGRPVVLAAPADRECREFGDSLAAADFDGDRYDDLAIACASGLVQVVYGRADLQGVTPSRVDPGSELVTENAALAAGDVTGDGHADLVVESGIDDPADAGYEINVVAGSPRGLTSKVGRTAVATDPADVGVGDIDRDGRAEVVVDDGVKPGLWVYPGTPQGMDTAHAYDGTAALAHGHGYIDSIAVGDVNGDGHADVALGSAENSGGISAGSVTVLFGRSDGLTGAGAQRVRQGSDGVPGSAGDEDGLGGSVAFTDLDGDGRAELAAAAPWEAHGAGSVIIMPGTPSGAGTKGAVMLCGAPHTSLGAVLGGG